MNLKRITAIGLSALMLIQLNLTNVLADNNTTYTITYDYSKTASTTEEVYVAASKEITLPTAERTGYCFDGWYSYLGEFVGGGGDSYTPNDTTTLFARWTPLVTFDAEPVSGYYYDESGTLLGTVSFNFQIHVNDESIKDITTLGINIYSDTESPENSGSDTEFNLADKDVMHYDGWFHCVVDRIAEKDFDKPLYAMPYIVVGGEVIAADTPISSMVDRNNLLANTHSIQG
jgi:uncharacterized repeat protein (TIGR02543 family)